MRSCDGTVAPQQQTCRIAYNRKTSTTASSYHNGTAYEHALTTVLNNATHDNQHHRGRCEVVEIGRDDEGGYSDSPKQTLRIVGLDPFLNKVETAIVIENLDDSHRGQQEHNDTGSTTHIIQENLIANVEFYSTTRRYLASQIISIFARMLRHDEIGSPTDIEHPTHRTKKHGYSSLVNTSQMTCRYEQISEE